MALAAGHGRVSLGATVSASSTSGTPSVSVSVSTAGQLSASASGQATTNTLVTQTPHVGAGGFVKASGGFVSGTLDQWLDFSEVRTWSLDRSTQGTNSDTLVLKFAPAADDTRVVFQITLALSAALVNE